MKRFLANLLCAFFEARLSIFDLLLGWTFLYVLHLLQTGWLLSVAIAVPVVFGWSALSTALDQWAHRVFGRASK